ncbi:MAG TPA: CBS domain-containing protein [Acidimicrobiales bacterium]|jgi:CBS domain-containing protein|nr:CBS domain-containing protein [Acidimicrobiales bacterium]
MAQRLRDVMTPNPVTCPVDATLVEVARLMRDRDIGNVIVLEEDRLAGILTDRDIVVRAVAAERPFDTPIGEIVSRDVVAMAPDDEVADAVQVMRERAIRRVPVVDGGRPVGIVSIGDLAVERDPDSALADISASPPNND